MQSSKKSKFGIFIIFMLMFLSPFIENTRGIFIPIFKEDFSVSNTVISTMIMVVSVLGMGVTLLGGAITEKFGQKKTIFLGIFLLIAGILIQSQAQSFTMFFIGFVPIIAGINLYNVAANTIIPILFAGSSTIAMNLLHFMYGAGSTVSQNAISVLLDRNITWRNIYVYIAVFYMVILVLFKFAKIPNAPRAELKESGSKSILRNPLLYAFGLALGFYAFAEQGISLWLTNYLKDNFGLRESIGAKYIGMFFLVFAVGRLLGGFLVQKAGVLKSVTFSQVIALVLFLAGIIMGEDFIIIISLSGLFFSIIYPSLLSMVVGIFKERPGYATGIVITLVSLVLNTMNMAMGIMTDLAGSGISIYLLPFSLLMSILCVVYIRKKTSANSVKEEIG